MLGLATKNCQQADNPAPSVFSHVIVMKLRFVPPKPRRTPAKKKKWPKKIWWPSDTAISRKMIEVGVPFIDKFGEKIIVERDEETGGIKSKYLGTPKNQK